LKGIILAGGSGTRLFPLTNCISKQLLPVYDKPMIYYPLSVLMLAGIKDILIISTPKDINRFSELFQDGSKYGLNISYATQQTPKGLAEAFIIGEDFIGNDSVSLILGDNIFYGQSFSTLLQKSSSLKEGAKVFLYKVKNPSDFGVVEFDQRYHLKSIEEKPKTPKSDFAITGIYFYDNKVVEIAKNLKPSPRGELEITDINKEYLQRGQLHYEILGRGFAWLDTGTHESLLDASQFIQTIEKRQGFKVACIEEIAYYMGYINKEALLNLANPLEKSEYGKYLLEIAHKPLLKFYWDDKDKEYEGISSQCQIK
jgi:glucose-1-phosphate thymidylyltransferase